MRRSVTKRDVPSRPPNEDFFIRLAADTLMSVISDLRCRVKHTGTRSEVAQVLLAEAHIDEAVGLLKAIQPKPRGCETDYHRPSPNPALYSCNRVQGPGRRHRVQGVAV
jgi:hypothetical protein